MRSSAPPFAQPAWLAVLPAGAIVQDWSSLGVHPCPQNPYARFVTTISHIVLVSWRSDAQVAAEELIRPLIRDFVHTIPGVVSVVEGDSSSPEGLENGYEYGFVVTFASPQARDAYLDDPNHRPVAAAIGAAAERIVVFDI
jgi:hypothetical protein